MQDDGSSICLLTKGGVSYSRRSKQNVILLQYNILRSTAVLLTAMQQNVKLIFVWMPVVTIIHDIVCKASHSKPLTRPFHFVIG